MASAPLHQLHSRLTRAPKLTAVAQATGTPKLKNKGNGVVMRPLGVTQSMDTKSEVGSRSTNGTSNGSAITVYTNGSTYANRSGNGSANGYANNGNGASTSNGNGNGSGNGSSSSSSSSSSVVVYQPGSSNGNGFASRNGSSTSTSTSTRTSPAPRPSTNAITVASAPLKSYMPAMRTAAGALAQELESQRPPSASPPPPVIEAEALDTRQFAWAQDSYSPVQRTVDTWLFFVRFRTSLWALDKKWAYPGGFTDAKRAERVRSLARYLLESVLQLGPTFIKIGQLSSTRSDLFPGEFIEELAKLQDRVPAFPASKAIAIIERDLGQSINRLYKSFDPKPIAAASLGQVHRAVLHSGEEVVVKVQRPGLKQLFDIDLNNLRILAEQLDRTSQDESSDFVGIYQECATVLYKEIDYIQEGRSADRFRRNFRNSGVNWVKAPVVYWEYCSPRVLTLQYLPGVKITDKPALTSMGLDLDLVARRSTEAYLVQILKHGFFHADPHPGNLSVDSSGRLLFYDFGMMGEIVPDVKDKLLELFYGTYRKDASQVLDALIALGIIRAKGGDTLSLRRSISYFLANIARQTSEKESIAAIGEDLFAVALDQPFRFPATFTFVLRAFSTLEGIGKTLNPEFKFVEVATPYAQELLASSGPPEAALLQQLQQQVGEVGQAAAAMPLRIRRIDTVMEQLEAGDLKLRVRVLEAERADRRQGVLQIATLQSIASMGLLNLGTTLALSEGQQVAAAAAFTLSGVFGVLVLSGVKRVQRLDRFEKQLRG